MRAGDLDGRRAGLLTQPHEERGPRAIDHVVDDRGGDDLAPQAVPGHVFAVPVAERLREVRLHRVGERRLVRQLAREQLCGEGDLATGEQYGELRRREPGTRRLPRRDLIRTRQELEVTVEVPSGDQHIDQAGVHVQHLRCLGDGIAQGDRLLVVVAQHQRRDLVAHGGQ